MNALLLSLAMLGGAANQQSSHPLAPSLPAVTQDQENHFKDVVDRFILFDIGQLRGAEGAKANREFHSLPPQSIFQVLDGYNRSADMQYSCPVVVIGQRVESMLRGSTDLALLTYAREKLGSGVRANARYGYMLHRTKEMLGQRIEVVQRETGLDDMNMSPGEKALAFQLLDHQYKEAWDKANPVARGAIRDLEHARGVQAYAGLVRFLTHPDGNTPKLAKVAILRRMSSEQEDTLKDLLRNETPQIRMLAARVIGYRNIEMGPELINLLSDRVVGVQSAARESLVLLSGGLVDHGPESFATATDRDTSIRRWRDWWDKRNN